MGRRRTECTKQINNVMSPGHRNSSLAAILQLEQWEKNTGLYLTQMCSLLLTTGKSYSPKGILSKASFSFSRT